MFSPTQKSGITRRFRQVTSNLEPEFDEHGFVVPTWTSLTIDRVLSTSAVLVRGQPWTGKTFVANELFKQQETLKLGNDVWPLQLADHTLARSLKPSGWDDWLLRPKNRARWIIDSVDEGESIQRNVYTEIIRLLEDAGQDVCRKRLRVILFIREAEATEAISRLCSFLDKHFGGSFADVELLPLDRENAERIIGATHLIPTLAAIKKFALSSVARYPAALEYIGRHATDANLTEVDVWRGVLTELLRERKHFTPTVHEPQHLFRAAARLAVVMTFAEIEQVSIGSVGSGGTEVADLIGADTEPSGPTPAAGREAVKTTMFHNGRFAQKNIREWMCAFGLTNISLSRIKPLITDSHGNLERKHFGVLSLLHKTTEFRGEVGRWLYEKNGGVLPQSDVALSLDEAISIIDRLESIADKTSWSIDLWGERGLHHLATPGIGRELAVRVADETRSANCRELLLQIAFRTQSREVLPIAVGLVQDRDADEELRQTALACLVHLGTTMHFLALESFVREVQAESKAENAIISTIILHYLDHQVWSVEECAKIAPTSDDSTHMLAHQLQEVMTIEAARVIVELRLPMVLRKHRPRRDKQSRGKRREDDLLRTALDKLLSQEPPNEDDLANLMPLALHVGTDLYELLHGTWFHAAYARSTVSRRKLFLAEIRRNARRKPERRTRNYIWILCPGDVEWLMERIVDLAEKEESVWNELLRMARGTSTSLKRRARALVREYRPDIVAASDGAMRRHRQSDRRRTARRELEKQQEDARRFEIKQVVQDLVQSESVSLQEKMWQLSWICLGGDQQRPHNIVGNWEDVPDSLRTKVFEVCQKALETCDATPIPEGSTFPSRILYEAWCFRDVLLSPGMRLNLTSDLIRKWLPSVFMFDSEGQDEVIAVCYRTDRDATETVFLNAIERELRDNSEYMSRAGNLSEEYWSGQLAHGIAALITDAQYTEHSRAELLRILANKTPDAAEQLLRQILETSSHTSIWHAAIDSFLRVDAGAAWRYVRTDFNERGKAALLDLRSLYNYRRPRINIDEWPPERLLDLARMVHITFPPDGEPERDGFVTPERELSDVRASIPRILFQRGPGDDRTVLEQLVGEQPYLKDWYDRVKAREEVQGELARTTSEGLQGARRQGPPPYQRIVKLLANADYRIVRHEDDLLAVIEEELRTIASEAGRHIEMLYLPEEISQGTKRRHEAALQSYIECRLADRLPGRILDTGTQVSFHREGQVQFRERTDIQIVAPLLHSGLGYVVIEVKWSDNNDRRRPNISTALTKQLGDRYLRGDGRTHGIYLVGWNGHLGKWRSDAGKPPEEPVTAQRLEVALQRQARKYMDDYQNIRVLPIVIDLAWPER